MREGGNLHSLASHSVATPRLFMLQNQEFKASCINNWSALTKLFFKRCFFVKFKWDLKMNSFGLRLCLLNAGKVCI